MKNRLDIVHNFVIHEVGAADALDIAQYIDTVMENYGMGKAVVIADEIKEAILWYPVFSDNYFGLEALDLLNASTTTKLVLRNIVPTPSESFSEFIQRVLESNHRYSLIALLALLEFTPDVEEQKQQIEEALYNARCK